MDELGVTYKQQESIEDLKDKHPLRFDFTIYQDDKLIAVIEFNGIQHYKPRSVFGGEKAFQMQKKHDLMKVQYCVDHGLYLLQIPYKTCECDTEEYVRRLFRNLDTYQKIMENQTCWQRSGILHQKLVLDDDVTKKAGINTEYAFEDMEGDHIIPWSKGGHTTDNNLQMLCKKCNAAKLDK